MEHRENIILYNVLNQEIVFEEYFCNLLGIDSFRNMFINFISKKNVILKEYAIEYKHFDTEVVLDNNFGRADLFLEIDDKNKFIFEIKNKNWTDLTDRQPNSYLKYLKKNNGTPDRNHNKHLFFLIPNTYRHQEEILNRWKNHEKDFDDDDIKNQIFYWEDLIAEMKDKDLHKQSIAIQLFCDFCEYWFNLKKIEFTGEEMDLLENITIPNLMEKLENIARKISDEVGLKEDPDTIGFFHTKKVGDYRICFGIDYTVWKEKNLPLSIWIQKKNYKEFNLNIEGLTLEGVEFEETSISDKQFAYIVILDEKVGSENYEKNAKEVLSKIHNELKNKRT